MEVSLALGERCPHRDAARRLLAAALAEAGLAAVPVRELTVRDEDEARAGRCIGSPTVRVDGLDVEYMEREPAERSAACRYFNTPGGWQPLPDRGLIVRALELARERDAGR